MGRGGPPIQMMKTEVVGWVSNPVIPSEFFNLFNHAQFNLPTQQNPTVFDLWPDVGSPTGSRIVSTSVNPRIIQLALKFIF